MGSLKEKEPKYHTLICCLRDTLKISIKKIENDKIASLILKLVRHVKLTIDSICAYSFLGNTIQFSK